MKYLLIKLVVIGIFIYLLKKKENQKKDKKYKKEVIEHFADPFSAIGDALKGIGEFFINFPELFMTMVDAMINFFLSIVDIFLMLVSTFEWIVNLPIWVVEGSIYIVLLITDVILLIILYLNPITMIKGIIRMIIFMVKVILAFFFDMIVHIIRQTLEYFLDKFRDGLWGIPHGPKQHVEHANGLPIDENNLGPHQHHHSHEDGEDGSELHGRKIYHPMRCYKGIGADGYLNIVAIILCPPLGVFMSFGLSGWFKILIACVLSLLFYFPGLIYALLVTSNLGLGIDIKTEDCGGSYGGYFVKDCGKRRGKQQCEDARIPHFKDVNNDTIQACKWEGTNETEGTCSNLWFHGDSYSNLIRDKFDPDTNSGQTYEDNADIGGGFIKD